MAVESTGTPAKWTADSRAENDIPGAVFHKPHTVPALKWWLLCRGIKALSSMSMWDWCWCCTSHCYSRATTLWLGSSNRGELQVICYQNPKSYVRCRSVRLMVMEHLLNSCRYSLHVHVHVLGRECGMCQESMCILSTYQRVYHWSSGCTDQIQVNIRHPDYCHVRYIMSPSMKPGSYQGYVLLKRMNDLATVLSATCECAAGWVYYCSVPNV